MRATNRCGTKTLRIGAVAGPLSAGELTGPIVEAFRHSRPDIVVTVRDINFLEQVDLVVRGVIDIALVRCPVVHDDVEVVPLASDPRALFVHCGSRVVR